MAMDNKPTGSEAELRTLAAQAGQILGQQGLVDYLGHVSARVPGTDRVVVKPKHSPRIRSMERLTGDHMAVVDLDGNLLEGDDAPPAEVFIHTEIYKARPDVGAVVHTHQRAATLMGVMAAPILPILHVHATFVDREIPIWPCPLLVTDPERGSALAKALGDGRYCHLQGHGIVSVAADLRHATVAAVMLEQLADANLQVLQAGQTPRVIPAEEIADLKEQSAPVAGRWAYYRQQVEENGG
jgi:L-ribulose-5-phosphate 4-epimerase